MGGTDSGRALLGHDSVPREGPRWHRHPRAWQEGQREVGTPAWRPAAPSEQEEEGLGGGEEPKRDDVSDWPEFYT